ncbi:radical SAM protein [[Eubacterium] cellulosolvens]
MLGISKNAKNINREPSADPFIFLRNGGKKFVNFAVTNYCNAKCKYCQFHRERDKINVSLDDARRAIDYLCDINTGVLALTGGEPLLNPSLPEIVKYAHNKGLIVYTGTNSLPLTEELATELGSAGVTAVWISFESSSYAAFNENRGVPGLHIRVKEGAGYLKNAGVTYFAISLINKSITNFGQLVERLAELGFDKVKFDYPMNFKLDSSYKGWGTSVLINYTALEMESAVQKILKIKKDGPINVINPISGLKNAVDFYHSRPPRYPCYAGEKVLYLDWNLDIYRCPALGERLGKVGDEIMFQKIDCNKCYYQGVRDYDAFYYLLEKFDRISNGLLGMNPNPLLATLNPADIRKLYNSLHSAWEIRGCGLV